MDCTVEIVEPRSHLALRDYESVASLASAVRALRAEASLLVPHFAGRRVWMVSSTSAGGGVAEMMPSVVTLLRELGVDVSWVVMRTSQAEFFRLTKRIHNLIHGTGEPGFTPEDRALYEGVSEACAAALRQHVRARDLVVVHDPQPLGAGALLKRTLDVSAVWRCHIGLDEHTPATRAAWEFLRPWAASYQRAIFSDPSYVPDFLADRSMVMLPTIDPLSHKNRELAPTKLIGILCNAGLLTPMHPVLAPPFAAQVKRLAPDGEFRPSLGALEIGIPFRPVITQVSRWDRLKGFSPLLRGFVRLKQLWDGSANPRQRARLGNVRLVLAGPDPSGVCDDPEGVEVIAELAAEYRRLPPEIQADVAILALPMASAKHNALMVNCLQRCSIIAVQNSLQEGFGLTATEAMWKSVPMLASRACGLRRQVRDGVDGRLVHDPTDERELARLLDEMLAAAKQRLAWGRSGQKRVYDELLLFHQLSGWLRVLSCC